MKKNQFLFLIPIIIALGIISISRVFYLVVVKNSYYDNLLIKKTNRVVKGNSAPRGRILDRNGNILVDNIGIKTIIYTKLKSFSITDEINIATKLSKIVTLDKVPTSNDLKEYWIITHEDETKNLITSKEYKLYDERKISQKEIDKLKRERITNEMLSVYNEEEQKIAMIYSLMNKGYGWEKKVIKTNISEKEYATIIESKIEGITGELTWERTYPYEDTLRSILGNISKETQGLPKEERDYYLKLGYSLNDRVGISYLEKQYEEYLKGEKDLYYINNDNTLSIQKEGKRGNDLVLSIDINIQLEIENILKEEITHGKTLKNTEYYDHSYVIISDPNNGSIIAMSGKKINEDGTFSDVTHNIINNTYTMGSVVKGASMTVGYQNNLINIDKKINDSCIKLYNVPEKCSHENLGNVNDITALAYSSNYYQFLLAIGVTGNTYTRGMKLTASKEDFDTYRNTFESYGLGAITGIDLPNEKKGMQGSTVAADLLLNLSIGNYDTYTPIELSQYINTIANNGTKTAPSLMLKILDNNGNIVKEKSNKPLGIVDIKEEYLQRIQKGFQEVLRIGTGRGYTDVKYKPAGKTGTAQSFIDSNSDGKTDIQTVSSSYAMYAPYDNPRYSMVAISPHISHNDGKSDYFAWINKYISKKVSEFLFENY